MKAQDMQDDLDGGHLLSRDKVEFTPSIEGDSTPPPGAALEEFFAVLSGMAWNG